MKSESIAKIALALSKAQLELQKAQKKEANPYFKSKYADLESVWEACREALANNELSVVQSPQTENDEIYLESILMHSSGEWISSKMPLLLAKRDPQTMGSALTYARRYALAALVGVVQSDDDGEKAMQPIREGKKVFKKVSLEDMKKSLENNMKISNTEHLMEYLEFVKEKVDKPLAEVLDSWLANPGPFKTHYKNWCDKKYGEKNSKESYKEEREQSLFHQHA